MMYFINLKKSLETILQRNVKFCVNDKILREGKIILYNLKDFTLEFTIITKKDQKKTYEIPVPFGVAQEPNRVLFDYSVSTLCRQNSKHMCDIKLISSSIPKKSKLYDNILYIEM